VAAAQVILAALGSLLAKTPAEHSLKRRSGLSVSDERREDKFEDGNING